MAYIDRERTFQAEQDGGPEQQGRKKHGKEVLPSRWSETTYPGTGQRRWPPVRKQQKKGVALLCLTQALRVRHRFSRAICL